MPKKINKAPFEAFAKNAMAVADALKDGQQFTDIPVEMTAAMSVQPLLEEFAKDKASAALALNAAISGAIVDERNEVATD